MPSTIALTVMLGFVLAGAALGVHGSSAGDSAAALPATSGRLADPAPVSAVSTVHRPGTRLLCIVQGQALRDAPSPKAKRLGLLRRGDAVSVLAAGASTVVHHNGHAYDRPWYRVRTATGQLGWAHGAFLHPQAFRPPTAGNGTVSGTYWIYPVGWSRQGRVAFVTVNKVNPATYGSTYTLVVLDARTGRAVTNVSAWDVYWHSYARRSGKPRPTAETNYGLTHMEMFWDLEKISLHEMLQTNGIVPGVGLDIQGMDGRARIGGVEYEDRWSSTMPSVRERGEIGGSLSLFRLAGGARTRVYQRTFAGSYRGERFRGWLRDPFTGALLFLVCSPVDDFGALTFVPEASLVSPGASRVVAVRDAAGLLSAIAPHTEVRLAPGTYRLGAVAGFTNRWVRREAKGWLIDGVDGLSLVGGGRTEVVTDGAYEYVLRWQDCVETTVRGISFGHADLINNAVCDAGVLHFMQCLGVRLADSTLWGCGTEGLTLSAVEDCVATRVTVTKCTMNGLVLWSVINAAFRDCLFADNLLRGDLLRINEARFLSFERCRFERNRSPVFVSVAPAAFSWQRYPAGDTNVVFNGCRIAGNSYQAYAEDAGRVLRFDGCTVSGNVILTNQ